MSPGKIAALQPGFISSSVLIEVLPLRLCTIIKPSCERRAYLTHFS